MNLSASSPHLTASSSPDKFILPGADGLERSSSLGRDDGLGDSGIVKDKLDAKCSIASGGYWTPRETLKRKKDSPSSSQGCNDGEMKAQSTVNNGSSASHVRLTSGVKKTRYSFPDKDWKDFNLDYLDVAKLQLKRMSEDLKKSPLNPCSRHIGSSLSSLNDTSRLHFVLSQTPPMAHPTQSNLSPVLHNFAKGHRGELDMSEKYNYDLSKAQLKASSRTSALLAGFAMVALVELQYDDDTPHGLLIILGVVTSLLVSVHLLALMMSTCILPYMEATGCTQDSPHIRLKFYIDLSWLFSTCIGLLLFLVEVGIIFFVKFDAVGYRVAGYITTAMLIPVVVIFVVFSYLIHKSRVSHSLGRFKDKVDTMKHFLDVEAQLPKTSLGVVKDI